MITRNSSLPAFVLGAIAGGVAALLLAPMSGERLRARIAERRNELENQTAETARIAADTARDTVGAARETAQQTVAAVGEAVKEGRAAYKRQLEKANAS